jgi:hypothetical protein
MPRPKAWRDTAWINVLPLTPEPVVPLTPSLRASENVAISPDGHREKLPRPCLLKTTQHPLDTHSSYLSFQYNLITQEYFLTLSDVIRHPTLSTLRPVSTANINLSGYGLLRWEP